MFTSKFDFMKYVTIIVSILIMAMACQTPEPEQKETTKPAPKKVVQPKKVAPTLEPEPALINNKNVEDTLLAYGKLNKETVVDITTSFGKIRVKLFEDTPLHRANFIMLTKERYFDSTVFNRVVPRFMAQCGAGSIGRHTDFKRDHGKFTIPAEMKKSHFHKKGAVAMARNYNGNPDKRSDPYAFYFVEGQRFLDETLDVYEEKNKYTYTKEQRAYYTKNEGAAHIDGQHTVFGQVISGYEVIPKLTAVATDRQDWPRDDIYILNVEIVR